MNTRYNNILTDTNTMEHLFTIDNFPVYMGCVDDLDFSKDLHEKLIFDICKKTGFIQIRNTLPLDITNKFPHNDGVGKTWKEHNDKFVEFIQTHNTKNVLEIGGGSGNLAKQFVETNQDCIWWNIIDKNCGGISHQKINVIREWVTSNTDLSKYDVIIHSHLLEHVIDPKRFFLDIRNKANDDVTHIFSVPNLYLWMKNKFTNTLNFEHTTFITEPIIDNLLISCGFKIQKKYYFKDHSIFYSCKKTDISEISLYDNYEFYKSLFKDFIIHNEQIIQKANESGPFYLFGAHIFSQHLIALGLNTENVIEIIDNSKMKYKKRLYGTKFVINNPTVLKDKISPIVLVRAGAYTEEIKEDILTNINPNTKFI